MTLQQRTERAAFGVESQTSGVFLARFAEAEHWVDDQAKVGWIWVEFGGEVMPAKTLSSFGSLQIPSLEWLEKFRDKVWALVEFLDARPEWLICTGVAVLKDFPAGDTEFDEWLTDYPYVRINLFTENWKVLSSDKADANHFTLRHTDGTELKIDRTAGEELMSIIDGVHAHTVVFDKGKITIVDGVNGHIILMDENGIRVTDAKNNNLIQMEASKVELVHKGGAAKVTLKDGKITLDAGSQEGGVLTTKTFDPFTGRPHIDGSTTVKATK
jgi:hypothetical protein